MPTTKPGGLPPLLKYAPAGTYVTVDKLPHGGSLQARMLSTQGIQFYWRYRAETCPASSATRFAASE